ncbi:hypothetical protein JWJ90_04185 [Desulfobulbus rhabdoformis]|jgi:hypothetical protein|uniref:hypothetical protein n=1 Tax=Desulfobulbus rhabdoformis TaxID=34032 RepID=UPI0019658C0D|nr:hypothetical protein [Desulfobulbus rhabdoformis]MBM9613483.1 hypothetical protein [Desulfobulbus rhabdoformis]
MGFIEKFVLPKDVDLSAALSEQTTATKNIVHDLYAAYILHKDAAVRGIKNDSNQTGAIKHKNMKELLDVFIAPYDKESIFRIITQLDWIALSVKHFVIEAEAYTNPHSLEIYRDIFDLLKDMADLLEEGFKQLSRKELPKIDRIHDKYDLVVKYRAQHLAKLLLQEDCKRIIVHAEILAQLKEIAKRMHISANTLEDMAIKVM